MNKEEAISFLKQSLSEIPKLAKLSYDNQEFKLWCHKVETVIKKTLDSDDYDTFGSVQPLDYLDDLGIENIEQLIDYPKKLKDYETALKSIIQKYEILGFDIKPSPLPEIPPKAFIAHGGRSGVLDKLREFIESLGIKPVIVELSPSRGMTVDAKVNTYIKDADCGIVLARKGGIVDTTGKTPKQHPRLNVIDELERLRAAFPEKTILLVERGVDLPSNVSGLTYEPFVGQSMDRAFTAIARELTAFGILKAVKP
jgi:hypothetical protein